MVSYRFFSCSKEVNENIRTASTFSCLNINNVWTKPVDFWVIHIQPDFYEFCTFCGKKKFFFETNLF